MKSQLKIISSLIILTLMVNTGWINAQTNTLLISADLRVNKFTADVGEELIFDAGNTIGPWGQLVFLFHDGSEPMVTMTPTVTHAFPLEGVYLVTLVAVGMGGITSLDTVEVSIINEPPSATLSLPPSAMEDERVPLRASAVSDSAHDLDKLTFQWILGDGTVKNGSEITYAWTHAGSYPVSLNIIDDQGALDSALAYIEVHNVPPTADFLVKTTQLPNGTYLAFEDQSVEFNACRTLDTPSDRPTLRYYWEFKDGTVGQGMVLNHTFHKSGVYSVNLTVRDDDGASSSAEKEIIVLNSAPAISLPEGVVRLREGETSTFTAASADTLTDYSLLHYNWSFGKTGWRASYLWTDEWVGSVSVEVQDPEGVTETASAAVEVRNVPPQVSVSMAYVQGNITLRAAGTPNNTIRLQLLGEGAVVANFTLDRIPGDPDSQAETLPFLFDLAKRWRVEVSYVSAIEGSNPTWLTFTFPDGSFQTFFHNFVVTQAETWSWTLDPHEYLFSWPITFNGTIFDPSSDSVRGEVKFNTVPILSVTHEAAETFPVEVPFEVTVRPSDTSTLEVTAIDADGGTDAMVVQILNVLGRMQLVNLAPRVRLSAPTRTMEDIPVHFTSQVADVGGGPLTYRWEFGDGQGAAGPAVVHAFTNAGDYLVKLTVTDQGGLSTTRACLVTVENPPPYGEILNGFNATEDEALSFTHDFSDTPSDLEELRYYWDFGDGFVQSGMEVTHAYARSGLYTLTLRVLDDNGAVGEYKTAVLIRDLPPVIDGPFGFQAMEGTVLLAEVAVHDSTVDEATLCYQWEFQGTTYPSRLLATWQDDGIYNGTFSVTDLENTTSLAYNISLQFINQPPVVTASSFIVYGTLQPLQLKAYALDAFVDLANLTYMWHVEDEYLPDGVGICSTVSKTFQATGLYKGQVVVQDDTATSTLRMFSVSVVFDADGDGLTDEQETALGLSPTEEDTDGDWLADWYEWEVYGTSPFSSDSDGDNLSDGFDPLVGAGELLLGTDPLNPDTDGDNLTDGFEVLGENWNITVQFAGVTQTFAVWSDPLDPDTDNDNLTDYEEWLYGLNPACNDTDGDGESDWDEYKELLAAKFDSDEDGLSDAAEGEAGTDPTDPDSDDDGLSDWEEVYPGKDGFQTDPLDNDTDHDTLLDAAESYSFTCAYGARRRIASEATFTFQAIIGGHVKNATVTIGVSSPEPMILDLRVWVAGHLLFEELDYECDRGVFYKAYDVTQKLSSFTGEWKLWVSSSKESMLEDFKGNFRLLLNPLNPDCDSDGLLDGQELNASYDGWVTNPNAWDSDGDGWGDKQEIETWGTNPLSKDTDGDKVNDPHDKDPLSNLLLQVDVHSAHFEGAYWSTPTLCVVLKVEDQAVVTAYKRADSEARIRWFWTFSWTVMTTADFGYTYYFDIPDQRSAITLRTELWDIGWLWDNKQLERSYTYPLGTGSWSNPHTVKLVDGEGDWVQFTVQTRGMQRTNTLAIYEAGNCNL